MPKIDRPQGKQAEAYLRNYGLEKVHDAIVESETNKTLRVVLMEEGEPDWSVSINAYMIAEGLATITEDVLTSDRTPEEVLEWSTF